MKNLKIIVGIFVCLALIIGIAFFWRNEYREQQERDRAAKQSSIDSWELYYEEKFRRALEQAHIRIGEAPTSDQLEILRLEVLGVETDMYEQKLGWGQKWRHREWFASAIEPGFLLAMTNTGIARMRDEMELQRKVRLLEEKLDQEFMDALRRSK